MYYFDLYINQALRE